MEQPHNEHLPMELSSQLVTMMTTEHYNLQTGRSMTISEANGRSSLFVGAVSSGLIALAFVGQISQLGTPFYVFSLVVLPTLFFMGLITFERVMQAGAVDVIYAGGINRIRQLYLEYAPQMRAGVVAFLVSLVLHQRYQWSQVMRVVRTMRDLFPSQPDMKHTKR